MAQRVEVPDPWAEEDTEARLLAHTAPWWNGIHAESKPPCRTTAWGFESLRGHQIKNE